MITQMSNLSTHTDPFETLAVIGLGYIGLPTAAVFASSGLNVIGVDVSDATIVSVNAGRVPFVEPDLGVHLAGAVARGLFRAQRATPEADAYIVAVPTPINSDKTADLSYIEEAAIGIAPRLRGGELVILESTCPPGTTQHMADLILGLRKDLSIDGSGGRPIVLFAHCPERVLPGKIMVEMVTNNRIVGGLTSEATSKTAQLYKRFCKGEIVLTDATTAELTKLVENAYRDVNIAFANELSAITETLGVDVWELVKLANHHPRVNILQPGPGVGGHCIAVDPWFIVSVAGPDATLIKTAREVNDARPQRVVDSILEKLDGTENPVVAALGLSFKPNIDDVRQSPAIDIVRLLSVARPDVSVLAVDPLLQSKPRPLIDLENVDFVTDICSLDEATHVAILVDHEIFDSIPSDFFATRTIIDTRGYLKRRAGTSQTMITSE